MQKKEELIKVCDVVFIQINIEGIPFEYVNDYIQEYLEENNLRNASLVSFSVTNFYVYLVLKP